MRSVAVCCRFRSAILVAVTIVLVAGCTGPSTRPVTPPRSPPAPLPQPAPPADISGIPNPVPRAEPRSARGNPSFYEVFGKRYFVMDSAAGYVERGVASWYGPGFHAELTSNGEAYDMYAMTAAHKTLPLPCYVQVTNLLNGRSVTLRVNDRGPFKDGRIIDLSYTAAAKLDILRAGTAFVEVRAITSGTAAPAPAAPSTNTLYVQAGAFGTEANAARLLTQLRSQGVDKGFVRADQVNGKPMFRVRIGPIPSVVEFDRVIARLKSLGIPDARLAMD